MIAFIVGAAVLVIIICLVCCCCCPFCLLAKRNARGRVLGEGPVQQPQNVGMPVQSGYTIPPDQYQQMAAQQSYPPSGYNAPMPPSVPYPPQGKYTKPLFYLFISVFFRKNFYNQSS